VTRPVGIFSHFLGATDTATAAANARRLGLDALNVHRGEPDDLFGFDVPAERARAIGQTYREPD
jgi:hypothetical protein